MSTALFTKDTYTTSSIPYLFNSEIIEYDMKDAGFSIVKEFKQLPDYTIEQLATLDKESRTKQIGWLQKTDKEFAKIHKTGFEKARELFFCENQLEDDDIISIKKDAIFVTKRCKYQKIGKFIDFRPKHEYSSFIRINIKKNLEFYYNTEQLDVKGINDKLLQLHEDYMISFIKSFFNRMEHIRAEDTIEYTKRFIDKYKRKELEVGYYREFNSDSKFRDIHGNTYFEWSDEWWNDKGELDIHWNLMNILLPLIQIPL